MASGPISPVRTRNACSSSNTQTLPSPIFPVLATLQTASTTCSAIESSTANSILALGRESIWNAAARYHYVCPGSCPYPYTSVTVTPWMPISATAWRTSSNLKGLMTAVISFMHLSPHPSINRTAADGACAYHWLAECSFHASAELSESQPLVCVAGTGFAPPWRDIGPICAMGVRRAFAIGGKCHEFYECQ